MRDNCYLPKIKRSIIKYCSLVMLITCFLVANITLDATKQKLNIYVNGTSLDGATWQVENSVKQWINNNIIETFLNR